MKTKDLIKKVENQIEKKYATTLKEANLKQLYKACASTINELLLDNRMSFNKTVTENKAKKVYYLSLEFLIGKSLKNNIYNLGLEEQFNEMIQMLGLNAEDIYKEEADAGLGNGGLGRLAACYLDSLASLSYSAMGYSLLYEYGLFKQKIINGWQKELPDCWLPGGEVWLNERSDKIYSVKLNGYIEEINRDGRTIYHHKDYNEIDAIPYDYMMSGANSNAVNVLRLWKSMSICNFDIISFSEGDYFKAIREFNEAEFITKVLYPTDDHYQGKILRLKQQYFLVSASMQDIISHHISTYKDIKLLPQYVAVHINDTHPTLAIPELLRILIDEHDLSFEESWQMAKQVFSYTNHTVMAEALEKWPEDLIMQIIPRIYIIIKQIHSELMSEVNQLGLDDETVSNLSIIKSGKIRMANLCVFACHTVNGVSRLHSNIIKQNVFGDYYSLYPSKFTNVTNGITYRRWLIQSNKKLSNFLNELIGTEYHINAQELIKLLDHKDNLQVLERLSNIKYENKCEFARHIYQDKKIILDPNTRFDVHVKRIHEYKRQLLNVLKIISLLIQLEENPNIDITPQTFIFGGKAAPGYYVAKEIIELINNLSIEISKKPYIKSKLNVVYLEEYNVSLAERLFPASEVSQQISLAGKEASGTGNMKFMINGAVTMGTLDGANVEIYEQVGDENIFIFGLRADEVSNISQKGYNSHEIYAASEMLIKIIDRLNQGFNNKKFDNISRYLLTNYPMADPFMCLADFDSYLKIHNEMDDIYHDQKRWNKMALLNIAHAGIFSSDRSINEYCKKIWNLEKIDI